MGLQANGRNAPRTVCGSAAQFRERLLVCRSSLPGRAAPAPPAEGRRPGRPAGGVTHLATLPQAGACEQPRGGLPGCQRDRWKVWIGPCWFGPRGGACLLRRRHFVLHGSGPTGTAGFRSSLARLRLGSLQHQPEILPAGPAARGFRLCGASGFSGGSWIGGHGALEPSGPRG